MPIVVSHQPDLNLLARAGYVAGAGQYQQWVEEMSQRERMQERSLQANLWSQQMSQDASMQRMMYGAAYDQARAAQIQAGEQDFRREMADLDAQNRMDLMQAEHKNRRDQMLTEMESAGNADIVKFLTSQADDRIKRIDQALMDGYEFDGDGLAQYQAAQQQIAKIIQDPTVPGITRAQAIYEKSSAIPIPKLKRPNFQQEVESRTATITTPDGRKIVVAPVREMQVLDDGPDKPKGDVHSTPTEMVMKDTRAFADLMKMAAEATTKVEDVTDPETGKTSKKTTTPKPEESAKWAVAYIRAFEAGMSGAKTEAPVFTYNIETGEFTQ